MRSVQDPDFRPDHSCDGILDRFKVRAGKPYWRAFFHAGSENDDLRAPLHQDFAPRHGALSGTPATRNEANDFRGPRRLEGKFSGAGHLEIGRSWTQIFGLLTANNADFDHCSIIPSS